MTAYSQVFSVKSNARRAARKAKVDPDTVVACSGGFHFPTAGGAAPASKAKPAAKAKSAGKAKAKKTGAREGSGKLLETVLGMITAKGGATMPEILKATGWLPHTARARISGLAAKHKLKIERERFMGVTTYKATKA